MELSDEILHFRATHKEIDTESQVLWNLQMEELRVAIEELPQVQKRRFILHCEMQFTLEQIAIYEGCSKQAVKKSVDAAKKKIRNRMRYFSRNYKVFELSTPNLYVQSIFAIVVNNNLTKKIKEDILVLESYHKGSDVMSKEIENQVEQFCKELSDINKIYEDYSRSVDIAYTTLHILDLISRVEQCTQKIICERTFLPKTTVNTVITTFYKQGYIELRELPEDRRTKTIHLTAEGNKYADEVIPHIRKAEYNAMAELTLEQRKTLLEGMKLYGEVFRTSMFTE